MATYVFTCPEHGPFEIQRSILEPTLQSAECPAEVPDEEKQDCTLLCGEKSERVYSPPGIIFAWKN